MRKAPSLRAGERGFSLIEMLVSLAILGLVSVLLLGGIGRLAFAATGASRVERGEEEVLAAQRVLRSRIERLVPEKAAQSGGSVVDAYGDAARFDFIGDALDRDAPDAEQHLRLLRGADGDVALYTLSTLDARADPREPGLAGWRANRLLAGTSALAIRYFGPAPGGGASAWQQTWSGRAQPPLLVAIRIAFPPGDPRTWPDLIVRPRGTGIAGCQTDPTTARCAGAQ